MSSESQVTDRDRGCDRGRDRGSGRGSEIWGKSDLREGALLVLRLAAAWLLLLLLCLFPLCM